MVGILFIYLFFHLIFIIYQTLLFTFFLQHSNEMSFQKDLEFLLKGISEFDIRENVLASEALIHGPLSFPIGTTNDDQAFLAGTYYGKGRVILVTHELFIESEVIF